MGKALLLAQETIKHKTIKYFLFFFFSCNKNYSLSFYSLVELVVTHLCTLHSFKNIPHCIGKGVNQYSTQLLVQGTQTYHGSTETPFRLEISHE